jgi:hypothetical protein
MIDSASTVLERELGRLITTDPELQAVFGSPVPVFSYASETQSLPYIVYNETRLEAWDDDTRQGGEHTVLISVRSAGESEAFVKNVLGRIRTLWSRCEHRVSLSPYTLVMVDFTLADISQEADGQAYRATAQYRAITGGH